MLKKPWSDPFGGHLLRNSNAKKARPLVENAFMQIHLRARGPQATHPWKKNVRGRIREITTRLAQRHRIRLRGYQWQNNQLLLTVKLSRKKHYVPFIKALSGHIALAISGASKTKSLQESFWIGRPWTCIFAVLKQISEIKKSWRQELRTHILDKKEGLAKALGP